MVFFEDGELQNDAGNLGIFISGENFIFDIFGASSKIINDIYANIFTILDFEVDVFGDDWIVAVTDNEKSRLFAHTFNLMRLPFFDKAG